MTVRAASAVIAVVISFALTTSALAEPKRVSGVPFVALQQQINSLQQRIASLEQQLDGLQGPATSINVRYVGAGIFPGTQISRALCPPGMKVIGGGGIGLNQAPLAQSHPISDASGTIAFGTTGIGWQAATVNFTPVQAFAVCVQEVPNTE